MVSLFLFFFYLSFRAFIKLLRLPSSEFNQKARIEGMSDNERLASLAAVADEYTTNAYESIKTTISNESAGSLKSVKDLVSKHEAEIKAIIENQSNSNTSDSITKKVEEIMNQLTSQIEDTTRKVESIKGSSIIFMNDEEHQRIIGIVKKYIVPN